MTLGGHLRELRNRLVIAVLAIVVITAVAWFVYQPIFGFLTHPFCDLVKNGAIRVPEGTENGAGRQGGCALYFTTIFQAFLLKLKVSALVAVVVSAPLWLYQIWAFVTPGLRVNERKWTVAFLATSLPLFFAGAGLAYLVLAKGLTLLLSFVPQGFGTLITIDHYLRYAGAMVAIFGVAFELPLLILMLNLAGVLTFARLKKWQRRAALLIFVFAAVATPSQDPFSMLVLALSMTALFEVSVLLAYLNDRRRGRLGGDVLDELEDPDLPALQKAAANSDEEEAHAR